MINISKIIIAVVAFVSLTINGCETEVTEPIENYPIPDEPVRGMESFMERHGKKPYELFLRDGELLTHRVIFEDRDYGTEVWMIDDSPTVDFAGTASVWPAWNADASMLYLSGTRPGEEGPQRWLVNADYSRLLPGVPGGRPIWDRENPDIYFIHRAGELIEGNVRTGKTRTLATWEPYPRANIEREQPERSYGLTSDNRYIFFDIPNGGTWLHYVPGEVEIPQLGLHDGRPAAPQPDGRPSHPREFSEILVPGRHSVLKADDEWGPREPEEHNMDEWGPLFRVRTGFLVDRETGEKDYVIAPLSGQTDYLRTFISDRVEFPKGPDWEKFRIHKSDDMEEMFEIYRYYPTMTHGHETPSPDGEYFAKDANPTEIIRTRDGHIETINLSSDGSSYHAHWIKHPRFFVTWVRGWILPDLILPQNGNVTFQVFSDLTAQPVFNTKHGFKVYYSGGDFSMLSPDATKVHTASSMTGRVRNYVAVMERPRPPQDISWNSDGGAVVVSWSPSGYHRETRGYLVYRSRDSGAGYKLLTPDPVEAMSWRDETVQSGTPYYYVVTSLEHSGLESGYSAEAVGAGVDLPSDLSDPLVVYAEAEHAIRDIETGARPGLAMGADRRGASDWYYVYRHPEADMGRAGLQVTVPADEEYTLWARVRSEGSVGEIRWGIETGGELLEVSTGSRQWSWVRAGRVSLVAGEQHIALMSGDEGGQIDVLALASDGDFRPQGPRPEDTTPPGPPSGLRVNNVDERVNHLEWDPTGDPSISHYNVYASREALEEPSQRYLIASPGHEEMLDWGLRAGTRYYYAVTAVDRRRNESEPVFVEAETPPSDSPVVELELAFADADLAGPFEVSVAGGLRGDAYVVPEDADSRVSWEIEVPEEGTYYFWLRHLHRGPGSWNLIANQNIQVTLNGESITTIGGGATDLNVPDDLIGIGHPLADHLWTWAWPGSYNLEGVHLPRGQHTLTLEDLNDEIRYDVLLIINEPSFYPRDGRLRQR